MLNFNNEQQNCHSIRYNNLMIKLFLKILIGATFLIVFLIPGYTYFIVNKGDTSLIFNSSIDASSRLYILFRLFGLYGFALIWGQLVLGPFMNPLRRLFGPGVFRAHRAEGVFALIFATLHPLIFYTAYTLSANHRQIWFGLSDYFGTSNLLLFGYLGPLSWTLLVCTVLTAIFNKYIKAWRTIHLLNYLVFIFAFFHSYKIGTEVFLQPLNTLYLFYGLTFIAAVLYRASALS